MKNRKLNYTDKKIYLGIDVHRRKYSVSAVIDGEVVDNFSYSGSKDDFVDMLGKRYFTAKEVISCYEAGFSGFGLHRSLQSIGYKNIVVHAGSVETSSSKRKTDKRDAKKMSLQLYSGSLKGIYIPNKEEEDLRRINRLRRNLVKDRTRNRIRIRMLFHYYGILDYEHSGVLSYMKAQRIYVNNAPNFGEGFKQEMTTYLDNWNRLTKQIYKLNKELNKQSEQSEIDNHYRSVPGIGILTARTLTLELGDMSRFKNIKGLYSYIGLTPSEHSSGEQRRLGRISREGKPIIRAMLIQAAWKAISEDVAINEMYTRLKVKKGGKKAIVAVARKLVGIARSCAINKKEYEMTEANSERKLAA